MWQKLRTQIFVQLFALVIFPFEPCSEYWSQYVSYIRTLWQVCPQSLVHSYAPLGRCNSMSWACELLVSLYILLGANGSKHKLHQVLRLCEAFLIKLTNLMKSWKLEPKSSPSDEIEYTLNAGELSQMFRAASPHLYSLHNSLCRWWVEIEVQENLHFQRAFNSEKCFHSLICFPIHTQWFRINISIPPKLH
jgi:hypothetical protein